MAETNSNSTNGSSLPRKFKYEQLMLDDIDPMASPQEIRDLYSEHYPALIGAGISVPKLETDAVVYEFLTQIGTKGAKKVQRPDYALMDKVTTVLLAYDGNQVPELPPSEALEAV